MAYRLVIDWPDGTQSQSRPGPVETRSETGRHAMMFALVQTAATVADAKALGEKVRDAPLGKIVTHELSGYRFTVKEF